MTDTDIDPARTERVHALNEQTQEADRRFMRMVNTANAGGVIATLGFFGTAYANVGAGAPILEAIFWTFLAFTVGAAAGFFHASFETAQFATEVHKEVSSILDEKPPHPRRVLFLSVAHKTARTIAAAAAGGGTASGISFLKELAFHATTLPATLGAGS